MKTLYHPSSLCTKNNPIFYTQGYVKMIMIVDEDENDSFVSHENVSYLEMIGYNPRKMFHYLKMIGCTPGKCFPDKPRLADDLVC